MKKLTIFAVILAFIATTNLFSSNSSTKCNSDRQELVNTEQKILTTAQVNLQVTLADLFAYETYTHPESCDFSACVAAMLLHFRYKNYQTCHPRHRSRIQI
ncbi:hypothetical protein KBB68_02750 [Candidatus Babeliales bacterium]|nr:hypothetical protein [Candidatus Babeliales bacterium]